MLSATLLAVSSISLIGICGESQNMAPACYTNIQECLKQEESVRETDEAFAVCSELAEQNDWWKQSQQQQQTSPSRN